MSPLFGNKAEKAAEEAAAAANLVLNRIDRISGGHMVATSLGQTALAEGSVTQHIAAPSSL